MYTLGISAFYHDSAAALLADGRILAAAQEERFSRCKHDARFPGEAVRFCLRTAGCDLADLDQIVFYEKPFLKFERLLETYVQYAPRGFRSFCKAMPLWLREKLYQKDGLRKSLSTLGVGSLTSALSFCEHHLSHAASAFYPSPFEQALVLTMDGVGEWATTTAAIGKGQELKIHREIHFPHSLGLLFSAFTYYCGFKVNSGEYKLMGLAPYGEPRFATLIREHLIDIKQDGSFRLDQRYFDYCAGLTMTHARFHRLFGAEPRRPEAALTQRHMDLAASIQKVVEEVIIKLAQSLRLQTRLRQLCLAGGVALNCVANGQLARAGIFDDIWIQPAAGDAGGALGAALYAQHAWQNQPRQRLPQDAMQGAYLGPSFRSDEVATELSRLGAEFEILDDEQLVQRTASALADGDAVGWFQGRMEFGPRALGARSILGDPRHPDMQRILNQKIKFRESFRPFAPAVLEECLDDWFDAPAINPYMLRVDWVDSSRLKPPSAAKGLASRHQPRSTIPAVTHVDGSARVQTVSRDTNPRFHALIAAFGERTGCPLVINTSFNIRGEPIVCTPSDAFRCFMGTDMDVLAIENCFLRKDRQDVCLAQDYRDRFDLD